LTPAQNAGSVADMSNVLGDTARQQIPALSRLGWTLSRIQRTTGVRRETVSRYLKAAALPVRGQGRLLNAHASRSTSDPPTSRPRVPSPPITMWRKVPTCVSARVMKPAAVRRLRGRLLASWSLTFWQAPFHEYLELVFERVDSFGLNVMLESHFNQERFDSRETLRDGLHDRGHHWRHDGG
jgi:hypothetical protein